MAGHDTGMLTWAIILAVLSLVAGALGFTSVAGATATIARVMFGVLLLGLAVLIVASFALGLAWTF